MTVYYDSKDPLSKSLFQWGHTSVKEVVRRPEFWFYLFGHLALVFLMRRSGTEINVDWKASGAMQYFTTFFLTFYNGHCYARYEILYPACMDILQGVQVFTFELTVSFTDPELWNHRLQAIKYMIAAVYLFFMGITNDGFTNREWTELVKKGLLTKDEAQLLRRYHGPELFPVLTVWAFQVCDKGLEADCMWLERSQKIAHIHNRLDKAIMTSLKASRKITQIMALPIPFAYWHLMNLVFVMNFLLLSGLMASFATWLTIVPYSFALLIFMGLREVSNALADPFGQDTVDFPITSFLDHTFDQCVCLLQAFSHESAYAWTKEALIDIPPFTEQDVRHPIEQTSIFNPNYRPHLDSAHHWHRLMPLQKIIDKTNLARHLKESLACLLMPDTLPPEDYTAVAEARSAEVDLKNQELIQQLRQAEAELETLRAAYGHVHPEQPEPSDGADQTETRV